MPAVFFFRYSTWPPLGDGDECRMQDVWKFGFCLETTRNSIFSILQLNFSRACFCRLENLSTCMIFAVVDNFCFPCSSKWRVFHACPTLPLTVFAARRAGTACSKLSTFCTAIGQPAPHSGWTGQQRSAGGQYRCKYGPVLVSCYYYCCYFLELLS